MPSTTLATNSLKRIVVLMSCLATLQPPPVPASLNADDVDKYVITRRGWNDSDVFEAIYKTGHKCLKDVCQNTCAWVSNTAPCSYSCRADTTFFLLQTGSCTDTASVKKSLFGNCVEALGLESGKISGSLLDASSQAFDFSPSKGRMNSEKAWHTRGNEQCFEIDLLEVRHVLAIATQGYQGILENYGTFEIKHSYDGVTWLDYQNENNEKKQFTDTDTVKYNYWYFRGTFEKRFLRIYPKEYNRPCIWCKCLRVEVNGCSDCAVCSCFSKWPFFLKSVTLTNEGKVDAGSDNGCQGCRVPGNATYYNHLLENNRAKTTSVTLTESVTSTGEKDARTNGNHSGFSGVRIVIAVECAVVFGIFVLIVLVVFWKWKKLQV